MAGRAHISVYKEVLDKLANSSYTVINVTEFGDGTFLALIESEEWHDYKGQLDLYFEGDTIKFKRDVDV